MVRSHNVYPDATAVFFLNNDYLYAQYAVAAIAAFAVVVCPREYCGGKDFKLAETVVERCTFISLAVRRVVDFLHEDARRDYTNAENFKVRMSRARE